MSRLRLRKAALLAICAMATAPAAAAGDAVAGKDKAFTCMGCHGVPSYTNAYPTYHVPRLAGQHAQYLSAALHAYRDGKRAHATMHAQAVDLSDQDIEDIAAFFANYPAE